jgi:hypothetical protein
MAHGVKKIKNDIGLDVFNAMRFALCYMLLVLSRRPTTSDLTP